MVPQYFKLQSHDLKQQPGIPSRAVQVWLTTLVAEYDDPAARHRLADAARFTGGYRKLVEDLGLIYADNMQNPRGAEAIHQWVRTIPREIFPGTGITANDWLGGERAFKSNLSEVLFYLEIWSLGLDKMKFYENDNACRQVISFAQLRRNAQGDIDRVDLGDRYYRFAVDDQGRVTALLHTPDRSH